MKNNTPSTHLAEESYADGVRRRRQHAADETAAEFALAEELWRVGHGDALWPPMQIGSTRVDSDTYEDYRLQARDALRARAIEAVVLAEREGCKMAVLFSRSTERHGIIGEAVRAIEARDGVPRCPACGEKTNLTGCTHAWHMPPEQSSPAQAAGPTIFDTLVVAVGVQ